MSSEDKIKEALVDVLNRNEFCRFIKLEMLELQRGYGRGRIPYKKDVLNPYDTVHGGILYSLADIVSGTTACMCGYYVTTVSGNLNFLLPASDSEYVYCECRVIREGKHLIVIEVRLTNDKEIVLDSGEFTFFIMDKAVEELSEK